jgi:vacuolar-type H+-ATPase subunit C/Vma6
MQITVDDYSYVFVKIANLRNIVMTEKDLSRLANYQDIASLQAFAEKFFPGLKPSSNKVIDLERDLWEIYFKIIEKIISAAPLTIQNFIQIYLLKYEIRNIRVNLLGVFANISPEIRMTMVKERPVKMLGRLDLLHNLIKSKSIAEIENALNDSPYVQIFKTHMDSVKKSDEIFWLESGLDKMYYEKLYHALESFVGEEKDFVNDSILSMIDFYNINLIYRGFYNKIDMKKLQEYLFPHGKLINASIINKIVGLADLDQFIEVFPKFIKNKMLSKAIKEKLLIKDIHVLEEVKRIIFHPFFRSSTSKYIGDIPLSTMARIFDIILNKEIEIQEIVARAVQLSLEMR